MSSGGYHGVVHTLAFPLQSFFIALPLEGDVRSQFQVLQHRLQPFAECLSFQQPTTPHLTLCHWREALEIEYRQACADCERIARRTALFDLHINGVETFGAPGAEAVLFLSVAFSPPLSTLKKLCPWPNARPFHPHITIARIRHPQRFSVHRKALLKAIGHVAIDWRVTCLRTYATVDGASQTPLTDFPFAAG